MGTAWSNQEFVDAFVANKLGRKRGYGNYYVIDDKDNGHQFLMKKSTTKEPIVDAVKYSYVDRAGLGRFLTLVSKNSDVRPQCNFFHETYLLGRRLDFTQVDIIDSSDQISSVLMRIDGTLLLFDWNPESRKVKAEYWLDPTRTKKFPALLLIENQAVKTVEEARRSLLPQEAIDKNAWILRDKIIIYTVDKPMPKIEEVVNIELVRNIPLPWEYGLPAHVCRNFFDFNAIIQELSSVSTELAKKYYAEEFKAFKKAVKKHVDEKDKLVKSFPLYTGHSPIDVEGTIDLTVKGRGSQMYVSNKEVLITGEVYFQGHYATSGGEKAGVNCSKPCKVLTLFRSYI